MTREELKQEVQKWVNGADRYQMNLQSHLDYATNEIMKLVEKYIEDHHTNNTRSMYEVTFEYKQDSPSGGNFPHTGWKKEIKLFDAATAQELQGQIDLFLRDNHCGYRKHNKVINIKKL
ncbi:MULTISPECIES: hypothetical protein [Butyricimonas]|uniref:hypothetical protein n=1 Tax=Butyricimonas TaxID=574697 RepID=UPI0007FB2077|nr:MULTISPECIES: hypothetical protein [Butyricimonas]